MTRDELIQEKIEYVLDHKPIRYVLKRRYFFWVVENLDGNICDPPTIFKAKAKVRCDLYNSIFSLGHIRGINDTVNAIFE